MSNAVIRLQNHGCKNHPYFWIVISSKKNNLKGRIIEHVGNNFYIILKKVIGFRISGKQSSALWSSISRESFTGLPAEQNPHPKCIDFCHISTTFLHLSLNMVFVAIFLFIPRIKNSL
jgi:hypothetical protein